MEDEVGAQLQVSDPNQELRAADFQDVLFTVSDKVVNVLSRESRSEMDEEDKAFIARRVRKMTREFFDQYIIGGVLTNFLLLVQQQMVYFF